MKNTSSSHDVRKSNGAKLLFPEVWEQQEQIFDQEFDDNKKAQKTVTDLLDLKTDYHTCLEDEPENNFQSAITDLIHFDPVIGSEVLSDISKANNVSNNSVQRPIMLPQSINLNDQIPLQQEMHVTHVASTQVNVQRDPTVNNPQMSLLERRRIKLMNRRMRTNVIATAHGGRGNFDPVGDLEAIKVVWPQMQNDLLAQDEEYKAGVKQEFNELFRDEKLGDFLLNGEASKIDLKLTFFSDEDVQVLITAFEEVGLVAFKR